MNWPEQLINSESNSFSSSLSLSLSLFRSLFIPQNAQSCYMWDASCSILMVKEKVREREDIFHPSSSISSLLIAYRWWWFWLTSSILSSLLSYLELFPTSVYILSQFQESSHRKLRIDHDHMDGLLIFSFLIPESTIWCHVGPIEIIRFAHQKCIFFSHTHSVD